MENQLNKDLKLLNDHIENNKAFWASMVLSKIENKYNVKIVVDKKEKTEYNSIIETNNKGY